MPTSILYVTAGSADDALAIGRALVDEGLAACANVLPGTIAVYRWEGAVQQEPEAVLIVKTRRDLVDAATARIVAIHGYDCPCLLAFDVAGGHAPFIEWIAGETAQPPRDA